MTLGQRPKPLFNALISVNWSRTRVLGLRFGTPTPTQVQICYHPESGHWLEFMDGTNADAVGLEFPEEVRVARLEMMRTAERRKGITTTFHRLTQQPKPASALEPSTRIVKAGALVRPLATLPIAHAAASPAAQTTKPLPLPHVPESLPVAQPANRPTSPNKDPFAVFEHFTADQPPAPTKITSTIFVLNEQTTQRLSRLRAARERLQPVDPTADNNH